MPPKDVGRTKQVLLRHPVNPTPNGPLHAGVIWPLGEGIREQRVAGPCLADIKRE